MQLNTLIKNTNDSRLGLFRNFEFQHEIGLGNFYLRYPLRQFTKRALRNDNYITLPTGVRMRLPRDNKYATVIYISRCNCDWGGEDVLVKMLEPGRDFIDVGAHIGYFSLLASPLARRVYAFEPDPRNFDYLEDNARRVHNVTVNRVAVFSRSGTMEFEVGKTPQMGHVLPEGGGGDSIEVEMTTLDEFAETVPDLDPGTIKIDVEGFDLDVIRGARGLIERTEPLIYTEFAIKESERSNDVAALFADVAGLGGYSIYGRLKPKESFSARSARLREFRPEDSDRYDFHMLFLVPPRLRERFETLSRQQLGLDGARP